MKGICIKPSVHRKDMGEGSALVVGLLIVVSLIIIGIAALRTTETGIQLAGNQESHRIAFHHADSGVYVAPKVISECLDHNAEKHFNGIQYLEAEGLFYRQIMGFDPWDDGAKDLEFALNGFAVQVDILRAGAKHKAGGGIEFASGAEGIGVGSEGGVEVLFDMDSLGAGPDHATSNIGAVYGKILGVPGGL